MSWGVSPWVYPVCDSLGFLDLADYFLPHLGKFSTIITSSIFSCPFFLSSSSGTPMIRLLGHLTLSQRSLRLSSFLLILFSSMFHLFLPFYLLPHLSYLLPPLFYCWFHPECFLSHLLHYLLFIDFFISSRSLLNLSFIFSILVSGYLCVTPFCFQDFGYFYYHYSELFFR